MGGRLMRGAVAGCMLAVALAGCSSDDDPAPATATLGSAPPVTPTTDPYAVPAVIDATYVNRVLAGLDAAVGDVVRTVVREKTIPPEVLDRLKTLYMGEFLQIQLDLFSNDVRESFRQYKPEPGNKKTLVSELVSGAASCIFARVERDYSAVAARPNLGVTTQWIGLRPLDRSKDPSKYNPTPWIYSYDGFQQDGSAPSNPCAT